MPSIDAADTLADPAILEAELDPGARLRYVQRRMQEEEGVRLTIDTIAFVLRYNRDFEARGDDGHEEPDAQQEAMRW